MQKEKRRAIRMDDSLEAKIISGGKTYSGIVMNFSEDGLYMVTATANTIVDITPSTIIELKCKLPSDKKISLKCEVKWFQTKNSPHGVAFSMGMEILRPPKEYINFIENLR
ncbi:MAG: PilZ domain-containing protein [Nitrospirae bacterium]|nr:PilZ domain-containing protein [Nitrospirota bacterium]